MALKTMLPETRWILCYFYRWHRTPTILFLVGALFFLLPSAYGDDAVQEPVKIDMAMTASSLGNVNAADAIAGFKTYATIFAETQNMKVSVGVTVFDRLDELGDAVLHGELEIAGLMTQQYLQLRKDVGLDLIFVAEKSGQTTANYVILVHANSGLSRLSQLGERDLLMLTGSQMGMARFWLDVLLMEAGLGESEAFFRSVRPQKKLMPAVLPVFFQNADACLVTKSGFETMAELNPQISQELRIIESSPDIVPFVTCIRSGFTGPNREKVEQAYLQAHRHPAGQQLLLLFKFERMLRCIEQDLETTRAIFDRYKQWKAEPLRGTKAP